MSAFMAMVRIYIYSLKRLSLYEDNIQGNIMLTYPNIRVVNLEKAIEFYTTVIGMEVVRRDENHSFQYSLAWLGFGKSFQDICLELTYNWDNRTYDHGNAYGQLVIAVKDVYQAIEKAKERGAKVIRDPGPVKGGEMVIAFLEDLDGYRIEFVEDISDT